MKKTFALLLAVMMCVCLFAGCGNSNGGGSDSAEGQVYWLNFKPESD